MAAPVRDVRELRRQMGLTPAGGMAKPITPQQLQNRVALENEADFGPRWLNTYPDLPFVRQYLFLHNRNLRFDFCWPMEGPEIEPRRSTGGVALEMQGGIWNAKTGHNTGTGLTRDFEKMNLAQVAGWAVFQFSDAHAKNPKWLRCLAQFIRERCPFYN